MNLLVVVAVGVFGFLVLWAGQSLALRAVGEPVAWPLRFETTHPLPRRTVRVMVPVVWGVVLVLTPLALGVSPLDYYAPRLLAPPRWSTVAGGVAYVVFGFSLLHGIGRATRGIRPFREHPPATTRRKLLRRIFVNPYPTALVEELVFRALLLEQLLVALGPGRPGELAAIALSAAVFSGLHFVATRSSHEPMGQASIGLFFVGSALGAAYVHGDRALWLPIALHATGISCTEVPRLFTRFESRWSWLVGTREFPHAGAYGIAMMLLLAAGLLTLR